MVLEQRHTDPSKVNADRKKRAVATLNLFPPKESVFCAQFEGGGELCECFDATGTLALLLVLFFSGCITSFVWPLRMGGFKTEQHQKKTIIKLLCGFVATLSLEFLH